ARVASGHVPAFPRPPRVGRGPRFLPPRTPPNRQVHVAEGLVSRGPVPRPAGCPDIPIAGGVAHAHRGSSPDPEGPPPAGDRGRDPEDARVARRDSPPHG